ncbi:MAG: ATP-binding protein [Phycisphaerales bacterium]|nr:ATP-binding protein [Phycisphaerales bacterium]
MKPGRFFWKLFLGNALLMALILGTSVWLIVWEVERAHREDLTKRLLAQAVTLRHQVQGIFGKAYKDELQALAAELGAIDEADIRVTIIAVDGEVWADSAANPAEMESHADRPEVVQALREGWGEMQRWSDTVHREMRYVAVRVHDAGEAGSQTPVEGAALGTVRVAMPVPSIVAQTETMRTLIWSIGLVALVAAVFLGLGLAYVWSTPVRRITETARNLSEGDLSARVNVRGNDEIAQMATSLNQMRDSLAAQLNTIDRQRQNLEYLIRTLTEGVIVADSDGRLVLMNPAADRLLNSPPSNNGNHGDSRLSLNRMVGQRVEACVAHPELRDMLALDNRSTAADDDSSSSLRLLNVETSDVPSVRELRLQVEQPLGTVHLLARSSDIDLSGTEAPTGAAAKGRLVVLTDITELTQTIRMKTDFVANASHELRTPLSTIRASVETLQKIDPARDASSAKHFMQVIDRHTSRLEELVGDLLDLSRLESSAAEFPVERFQLSEFLDELHARFADALEDKGLRWVVNGQSDCESIEVSHRLLRLVLDNLVANAIKFTDTGGHVSVGCHCRASEIDIEVADEGCGIPTEDQDRVFERFYQVERARSDSGTPPGHQRGTGLGLSIVRHAVAAMGGSVKLQSQLGQGTTVTITLPHHG